MEKKIAEVSIEAKLLYQKLSQMVQGDQATYAQLSDVAGCNIQANRGYLYTALRMCESENGKTFGVMRNIGIQCLNSEEIINTGEDVVRRVKKMTRRGIRRFTCITDLDSLSNESKIKLNTYSSVFGVLAHMTKQKTISRVEKKAEIALSQLPIGKMLDVFK